MTILETKKVDFISIDKKNQEVVLTISDHLDWVGDDAEHIHLLQEKINSYLRFVESGEMYQDYPKTKGRPTTIEVVGKFDLSKSGEDFMSHATSVIREAGFDLRFKKF